MIATSHTADILADKSDGTPRDSKCLDAQEKNFQVICLLGPYECSFHLKDRFLALII